jgi:hypothetical protein
MIAADSTASCRNRWDLSSGILTHGKGCELTRRGVSQREAQLRWHIIPREKRLAKDRIFGMLLGKQSQCSQRHLRAGIVQQGNRRPRIGCHGECLGQHLRHERAGAGSLQH